MFRLEWNIRAERMLLGYKRKRKSKKKGSESEHKNSQNALETRTQTERNKLNEIIPEAWGWLGEIPGIKQLFGFIQIRKWLATKPPFWQKLLVLCVPIAILFGALTIIGATCWVSYLCYLGEGEMQSGHYSNAIELYKSATNIIQVIPFNRARAQVFNLLANAQSKQQQFAEARKTYFKVNKLLDRSDESPGIASMFKLFEPSYLSLVKFSSIGLSESELLSNSAKSDEIGIGRHSDDLQASEGSLRAIIQRTVNDADGSEDAHVADFMDNLALIYLQEGKVREAESTAIHALEIRRKLFREEDAPIGASFRTLGSIYNEEGRTQEAEVAYSYSEHILTKLMGDEHPEVLNVRMQRASVLGQYGNFTQAMAILEPILAIDLKRYGDPSFEAAYVLHEIGWCYESASKNNEAQAAYERSLKMKQIVCPESTSTACTEISLASLHLRSGNKKGALNLYNLAAEIIRSKVGENSFHMADIYFGRGDLYRSDKRLDDAVEMYKRALEIYEFTSPPNHRIIRGIAENLVAVLTEQGKVQEANKYQKIVSDSMTASIINQFTGAENNAILAPIIKNKMLAPAEIQPAHGP